MSKFSRRKALLKEANLPPNVDKIIMCKFDFEYEIHKFDCVVESGEVSWVIMGVGNSKGNDTRLTLHPANISIGDDPISYFSYRSDEEKWIVVFFDFEEEGTEVKGIITLIN